MDNIPETLTGVRDALGTHIEANKIQIGAMKEKLDTLKTDFTKLETEEIKEHQMANETINVGSGDNAALMAMLAGQGNRNGGNDMFGGGGILGGLLLGTLLRNGGLGGNNGMDGAGAVLRSPPEQSQANMSLMAAIGAVDKSVALGTATTETSNAVQTGTLSAAIANGTSANMLAVNGLKDVVNGNAMALSQQINAVNQNIMENRYELSKDISNDGEKTRALITQQYEATLNRQLSDANAALVELRSQSMFNERSRGIEVTTTNNINQMQNQQQQQQQISGLAGLINNLANDLQYIRATNQAINVGSGVLTANPTNTNTNIR